MYPSRIRTSFPGPKSTSNEADRRQIVFLILLIFVYY